MEYNTAPGNGASVATPTGTASSASGSSTGPIHHPLMKIPGVSTLAIPKVKLPTLEPRIPRVRRLLPRVVQNLAPHRRVNLNLFLTLSASLSAVVSLGFGQSSHSCSV